MIRKTRTRLAPNARGTAIQDKTGAVCVAKLEKLSAAMFYHGELRICIPLVPAPRREPAAGQCQCMNHPVRSVSNFKLDIKICRALRKRA